MTTPLQDTVPLGLEEWEETLVWSPKLRSAPGYLELEKKTGVLAVFLTEEAVWGARLYWLASGRYEPAGDAPVSGTLSWAFTYARKNGCRVLYILDEDFRIIEEYPL